MSERPPSTDRRRARSNDTLVALCRMLEAARRDSGLSAVAVADETGCLLAGSGAVRLCEELAALSTLPANDARLPELGFRGSRPPVQQLMIDGCPVAISALGEAKAEDYQRISDGCRRILNETASGCVAAR